jgi:hypothetical protein
VEKRGDVDGGFAAVQEDFINQDEHGVKPRGGYAAIRGWTRIFNERKLCNCKERREH